MRKFGVFETSVYCDITYVRDKKKTSVAIEFCLIDKGELAAITPSSTDFQSRATASTHVTTKYYTSIIVCLYVVLFHRYQKGKTIFNLINNKASLRKN